MNRRAVAYVRRSHDDNGGAVSHETQLSAVHALAAQHGVELRDEDVLTDWGRSGGDAPGDALRDRPAFRQLLRDVESGHVSLVFAMKLDRLGRGQTALARLWAAAETTSTRIITREEGSLDADNPAAWLLRHTLSGFAEFYLREQKRKSAATLAHQRRRGDKIGHARLGYRKERESGTGRIVEVLADPDAVAVVLDAVREAGSYLGAARLLNERRVPVPMARHVRLDLRGYGASREAGADRAGRYASSTWGGTSVRRIIEREAPELTIAARRTKGDGAPARLLRGLLRCTCGATLTPGGSLKNRSLSYYCAHGHRDPLHPKPYTVSEAKLRAWVVDEAAHFQLPSAGRSVLVDGSPEPERDLAAERDRIVRLFTRGTITEESMDAMLADIDRELAARELELADIPTALDWSKGPGVLNDVLRTMWRWIELDESLRPVRAEWVDPRWRGEAPQTGERAA